MIRLGEEKVNAAETAMRDKQDALRGAEDHFDDKLKLLRESHDSVRGFRRWCIVQSSTPSLKATGFFQQNFHTQPDMEEEKTRCEKTCAPGGF